ncbi:hypothetical protein [Falsiroseomonas sp.]|uniref:hypothetical protein n=1 Tax=Falsiroseomonas sp. TaxID=2870721 RepID=UPI003562811D
MTAEAAAPNRMRADQAVVEGAVFDEDMYDATNISARRIGLGGVIDASTAQGQHGPRWTEEEHGAFLDGLRKLP